MGFWSVITNTHKEAIRDKILYIILVFAILMLSASAFLSFLSVGQEGKIIIDLGLSSINIFGLLITIFIGTNLLNKEIDKKTIYLILTKPIYRFEFLLGKHFGLALTLFMVIGLMAGVFFALIFITMRIFSIGILQAIIFIYLEMFLLTAMAIFFSTISSPIMSAVFTLSMYVIGHLTQDILNFGLMSKNYFMKIFSQFLYYLLPDLSRLNIKNTIIYNINGIDWTAFGGILLYGLLYSFVLLILAMIIFERKEF